MTTREEAFETIALIEGAALHLADCTVTEQRLADERALVKDDAISRLRTSGMATSVSAAKEIVERDIEFYEHRKLERAAVAARILAEGKLSAAKLRARLSVEMAAIDEAAREPDYEIVDDGHRKQADDVFDEIYGLLDKAGIIDRNDDGTFIGIVERVRLLVDQQADAEVAR